MKKGKLFILSAPSGTGKSTLLKHVMHNLQGVVFSISHTTRKPRKGESDGVEYYFVGRQEFLQLRDQGGFLEYAKVHENFYGTARLAVEERLNKGLDVILDIDIQGAGIIRDSNELEATYIFLAPPSMQELEQRLRDRGLDSESAIATRLENATFEMKSIHLFDYLIVNDKIDCAVKMFESVVLAERAKDRRDVDGRSLEYVIV